MIEPVPTFWNEFLNLIQMMKMLLEGKNKKEFNILNNFEIIINKFLKYLDQYLNKKKEDKIFMGPVYSTYEFITDIGTRLNDEEWKKEYKNYQSLNFNK